MKHRVRLANHSEGGSPFDVSALFSRLERGIARRGLEEVPVEEASLAVEHTPEEIHFEFAGPTADTMLFRLPSGAVALQTIADAIRNSGPETPLARVGQRLGSASSPTKQAIGQALLELISADDLFATLPFPLESLPERSRHFLGLRSSGLTLAENRILNHDLITRWLARVSGERVDPFPLDEDFPEKQIVVFVTSQSGMTKPHAMIRLPGRTRWVLFARNMFALESDDRLNALLELAPEVVEHIIVQQKCGPAGLTPGELPSVLTAAYETLEPAFSPGKWKQLPALFLACQVYFSARFTDEDSVRQSKIGRDFREIMKWDQWASGPEVRTWLDRLANHRTQVVTPEWWNRQFPSKSLEKDIAEEGWSPEHAAAYPGVLELARRIDAGEAIDDSIVFKAFQPLDQVLRTGEVTIS